MKHISKVNYLLGRTAIPGHSSWLLLHCRTESHGQNKNCVDVMAIRVLFLDAKAVADPTIIMHGWRQIPTASEIFGVMMMNWALQPSLDL